MSSRIRLRRTDGKVYLDRHGFENRWFGVFIHKMSAPDPGVHLHDHPWSFVSVILKGGYFEERIPTMRASGRARYAERLEQAQRIDHPLLNDIHQPRGAVGIRRWLSIKSFPLNECHRITKLRKATSWSLVIHGPRRKDWGFYTPEGYVDRKEYRDSDRPMYEEHP